MPLSAECSAPSSSSRASMRPATTYPRTTPKPSLISRTSPTNMPISARRARSPNMLASPWSRSANPRYAADIYRHAASYFGDAEAQYQLGRLYLSGEGVEKNPSLAVNWLATAAKKQHAAAQATLGELLWKGDEVRQRQARGLALLTLAYENSKAEGDEPKWIADLYQDAFAKSDNATRKEAELLLPELGPTKTPAAINAGPDEHIVIEAPQGALALPSAAQPAEGPATPRPSAPPPAPIGLSVGFGAQPNRP